MKIDPPAERAVAAFSDVGPQFPHVGVVRSAPESHRNRHRRTALVRSSRVRSVLPGWRPVLGFLTLFPCSPRSHPSSSGLTLLGSASCRRRPHLRLLLVLDVAPAGEVTVRDSFRDAVTGCTTSPRRSPCVTSYLLECRRATIPRFILCAPRRSEEQRTTKFNRILQEVLVAGPKRRSPEESRMAASDGALRGIVEGVRS